MIKAIRDEMKGGLAVTGLMAGVGWGIWLLLTVIYSLVLYFDADAIQWADIGSIVALVAVLFMGWIMTVSYTHLDVYKRQDLRGHARRRHPGPACRLLQHRRVPVRRTGQTL